MTRFLRLQQRVDGGWLQLDACQQLLQSFAAAFAFHRKHHRAIEGFQKAAQRIQRGFGLCLYRQIRQRVIIEISIAAFRGQQIGFQLDARPLLQLTKQFIAA